MTGTLGKIRDEKGSLIGFSIVYSTDEEKNDLFEKLNTVENFGRCLIVKVRIHNKNCESQRTCVPELEMKVD